MNIIEEVEFFTKADSFPKEKLPQEITFVEYLNECMKKHPDQAKKLNSKVKIDSSYYYQILSGIRNPGKDKVIHLAFGLQLSLEETNTLLILSKKAILFPRLPRDAVIIYALSHHYTIEETNLLLTECGIEELL